MNATLVFALTMVSNFGSNPGNLAARSRKSITSFKNRAAVARICGSAKSTPSNFET